MRHCQQRLFPLQDPPHLNDLRTPLEPSPLTDDDITHAWPASTAFPHPHT